MKNRIRDGATLDVVAPSGGVAAGDFIIVGDTGGVCVNAAAAGATVTLVTDGGVYALPKATSQAVSIGAKLYWDETNKRVTTTATGNRPVGTAFAAASADATTADVRISDEPLPAAAS